MYLEAVYQITGGASMDNHSLDECNYLFSPQGPSTSVEGRGGSRLLSQFIMFQSNIVVYAYCDLHVQAQSTGDPAACPCR